MSGCDVLSAMLQAHTMTLSWAALALGCTAHIVCTLLTC